MSSSSTPTGGRRTALRIGLGALAVLVLLWIAGYAVAGTKTPRGTTVMGVDVGGLDRTTAQQRLTTGLAERASAPIAVTVDGDKDTVDPREAGLSVDAAATIDSVPGRSWNPVTIIKALAGGQDVDPVVKVDEKRLAEATKGLADEHDHAPIEGDVSFPKGQLHRTMPRNGVVVKQSAARDAVREAYLTGKTVVLPTTIKKPKVSAAEVDRAVKEFAEPALSAPVTLVDGAKEVPVPASVFGPALDMVPDGKGRLQPKLDGAALRQAVAKDFPDIVKVAKDASFKISGGKPVVVPAVNGRALDDEALSRGMLGALAQSGSARRVTVTGEDVEPSLTTEEAQQLGVTEKISTFTQHFPYAPYRVQNIGTAARYIDGTLLLPGQTFSMNGTVKERTPENGYTIGTVISGGRFREELGGGVSTITTAMWTAAFYGGLERVEQRAHSFYISRYREGLEATVSWGALDLKFKNDSPNGVFIQAKSGSDFVTITMWGTKRYDVDASSGPRTKVRPPVTIYDPKPGCVAQAGVPGFEIVVTRIFKQGGKVVKREPLKTHYNVANQIYCRAAPGSKPTPSPTGSASPKPTGKATPKPSGTPVPPPAN